MKRIIKIVIIIPLLIVAIIVLLFIVIEPVVWRYNTRKESVRILATAKSNDDLTMAVGYLGLFLTFPDNSWMAIRYRDTHGSPFCSLAIVRDSGGEWFVSHYHFCGRLAAYRSLCEKQKIMQEMSHTEEIFNPSSDSGIYAIAVSKNLEDARKQLMKLGFTTMNR